MDSEDTLNSESNQLTPRTAEEIQVWIVGNLCSQMNLQADDIDLQEPLVGQGLDSMRVVSFVAELEEWLGGRFVDNPLFDYPTIVDLSGYLAEQSRQGNTIWDPGRDRPAQP